MLIQVRPVYVMLGQVRSGKLMFGKVLSCNVRRIQVVRLVYVSCGYVWLIEVRSG
jgi:hypothetical protein